MSGSLDTSVLVQLVTGQTPELAEAATQLVEKSQQQLAVSDEAMIELIFVLDKLKKFHRNIIGVAIEALIGNEKLNFNRGLFARAMPLYLSHAALSINDCCLAIYAELNNAEPLWTFDKKLANQAPQATLLNA